jgi:hypothetical protein
MLMNMRRMTPYTLVILMLLQSFALMVAPPVEAASGRGGTNDDYTVKTISLGNSSKMASQWIQSDGTVMDYIFVDTAIEIKVTVQRFGTGAIGETAPVMLEVIHPIGFIILCRGRLRQPIPSSTRLPTI